MNMGITTEITLGGTPDVLLSHMSLLGTALIVEEQLGAGSVTCSWDGGLEPRPVLRVTGAGTDDVGCMVQEHARRHADDDPGWMRPVQPVVGSLFSARTNMPTSTSMWHRLLAERDRIGAGVRGLDSAMILGLGERAWWLDGHKRWRPDHGAAAWEMKTRNRGMEFLKDGLLPLAIAVADRDAASVMAGLVGETVTDEVGKNRSDSRTGMGLGPLGPTDCARAWSGLWGIAALPMWPLSHDRSVSPASRPRSRTRRGSLLMPMPLEQVTPSRWRRALRSDTVLAAADADGLAASALRQLESWGFPVLMEFPVSVTGSSSAPERRTMAGAQVTP